MKLLIVYGTAFALAAALRPRDSGLHTSPHMRMSWADPGSYTAQNTRNLEDVVRGIVVTGPQDLDRLRGMEYDVVIEDRSFELFAPGWAQVLPRMCGPSSSSVYEAWRGFLRANVLR